MLLLELASKEIFRSSNLSIFINPSSIANPDIDRYVLSLENFISQVPSPDIGYVEIIEPLALNFPKVF